ncbi:MAG: TIGR02530 family flagellar biosynthesis protein [Bacillota bacterium]|jgi:flagellar operon protein
MTADRIDRIVNQGMPQRPVPVVPGRTVGPQAPVAGGTGTAFQDVLTEELSRSEVRFSAHARSRLAARRIDLGQEDLSRLEGGVSKAAAKGARESLILLDDKAFVVSVRNRTVITAVDGEHLKENVFTNIDSAVIV